MTVSEAIKTLQQIKKDGGAKLEVVVNTLVDGQFYIEYYRDIEIIQIPQEDGTLETVVAVQNFDKNAVGEE